MNINHSKKFTRRAPLHRGHGCTHLPQVAAGWLYTIRSVCADIDVLPIYDRDAVVGAIFILLYYIVVILVAINVFFSIMAATLMEATYDTRKGTFTLTTQPIGLPRDHGV